MDTEDEVAALAECMFGIRALHPLQRLVIANVMDALDPSGPAADGDGPPARQAVILPTGAGKSVCFQLPALLAPGITVAVYPLIGLMSDQARRLDGRGIKSVTLRGGMDAGEREAAFSALGDGSARLALVNPETLAVPRVLERLAAMDISHLAVDEAHCVSEWGDSFRPAYLRLGDAVKALAPAVVTAFTATASEPVLARVTELLFQGLPYRLVMGSPDRPNIRYRVEPTLSMARSLREAVRTMTRPLLVFASSRDGVALLAEDLRRSGVAPGASFYHAGLDREEREDRERWFLGSRDGVLCSTCAYGMGMDKPDIRSVVHYGLPGSVEAYLQESGRAGRDGEPAEALLIHPPDPYRMREGGGRGAPARARALADWALDARSCRRSGLLALLGHPDARVTACSGCDVCDGSAREKPLGAAELVLALARHRRRLDGSGLARFLGGSLRTDGDRALSGLPGWAGLRGWEGDELSEAVEASIRSGLAASSAWPWRGRLVPGPQSSGNSSSSSDGCSSGGGATGLRGGLRASKDLRLGLGAWFSRAHGSAT